MKNLILSFAVIAAATVFGASKAHAAVYELTCESNGYKYNTCPVTPGSRVHMVKQISYPTSRGGDCILGRTYGHDAEKIWVDNGCRAIFRVEEPRPVAMTLKCESNGYRYETCPVLVGRGHVRMVQQLSHPSPRGGMCEQNVTWGFNPNGIWVDHGCRAIFEIFPQ